MCNHTWIPQATQGLCICSLCYALLVEPKQMPHTHVEAAQFDSVPQQQIVVSSTSSVLEINPVLEGGYRLVYAPPSSSGST